MIGSIGWAEILIISMIMAVPVVLLMTLRRRKISSGGVSEWRRLVNFLLDTGAILLLSVPVYLVVAALNRPSGSYAAYQFESLQEGVFFWAYVVYYVVFEYFFQRTLGKMVTRTKVVSRDGQRPSIGRVLVRTLARFIPFEPLSVLFSSKVKGWHDSLSKTRVVNTADEITA